MSCLSGLCTVCVLGVICLVCLGCLSFHPTSYPVSVAMYMYFHVQEYMHDNRHWAVATATVVATTVTSNRLYSPFSIHTVPTHQTQCLRVLQWYMVHSHLVPKLLPRYCGLHL